MGDSIGDWVDGAKVSISGDEDTHIWRGCEESFGVKDYLARREENKKKLTLLVAKFERGS